VGVIFSALRKYPGPCSSAARINVVKSLQVCRKQHCVDPVGTSTVLAPAPLLCLLWFSERSQQNERQYECKQKGGEILPGDLAKRRRASA
jgi:hypothetical protein